MPNSLTTMTGQVPAHIQRLMAQAPAANSALAANVSAGYPIISYKGKVWHVVEGGERILVTVGDGGPRTNDPAASLEAVILLANPNLNKVYYPDGYEEGSTERPLCHSDDGITPSRDAQEPQAKACGACPHNEWGSKISDRAEGSRGKACADSRRMAIASPDDIENPMLLRCPAASLKTLLAYGQQLDKRGWPYHAMVTRIGFDASLAYPALTFTPERWLTEEELEAVQDMQDDDLVMQITALKPQPMADAPAPTPAAAPQEDAFARMERQAAAQAPAPEPEPAPRRRRAKATASEVQAAVAPQPEPEPEPAPAPARRGFGGRAAPVAEPEPAPARRTRRAAAAAPAPATNGHDTSLADAALSELEGVLEGFDDEEVAED
jgi:hypothetical protein